MIADWAGMLPIRDPILLPDVNASYAENTWLYEGVVRGFRQECSIYAIKYTDTQQVYRIPINTVNPPDFSSAGSVWMEFPDPYMTVIRNPTVGDQWDRYYFFPSDQYSKSVNGDNPLWPTANPGIVYNTLGNIVNGQPWLTLGVPIPQLAPTVTSAPSNVTVTATSTVASGSVTLPLSSVTNITAGMNVTYKPGSITEVINNTSLAGSTTLNFPSTAGIYAGMSVTDGSQYSIVLYSTVAAKATTNVLTFTSTSGLVLGMEVMDQTSTVSIYPGTKISVLTGTTVTLSNNILLDTAVNDAFKFINTPIQPNTVVTGVPDGTHVTINNALNDAGVWSSYTIIFKNTPLQPGTVVNTVAAPNVTLSLATVNTIQSGDSLEFSASTLESRAYLYTMVSAYGEEGPPSPPTVSNGAETGVWTVSIPTPATGINTGRNLKTYRLYRTVTDSNGNATYYQVTEVPINWSSPVIVNDNALDASITANQILPSVNYLPPPAGLQGVVMMANGIAAGFTNQREIWFSEPYLPHAWPAVYALTVDYPVVGLTANGTSLNIMTEGSPFIATGVTPDTMTIGKIVANEPCISRSSIIGAGEGGYYASPNGYILLNQAGTENITEQMFGKEFWSSLQPWNFSGGRYGVTIVAFIKGAGAPSIDPNRVENIHGCVIGAPASNTPFCYLDTFQPVLNCYVDEVSGQIFYITGGQVYQWNAVPKTTTNPPITGFLWPWIFKTKKFRFTFPQQFKAFTVLFDKPSEITFTPGARNTDQNQTYNQANQYMIVRVFADGNQIVVREVQTSGEILLIPGGSKWIQWDFQFEGVVRMKFFKAATSVHELKVA